MGKDADGSAVVISDIDGAGFEDLSVVAPGQISQSVLQAGTVAAQSLQHDMGGAVSHPAPGDVTILNGHNGVLHIVGVQVMNHYFAI